MKVPYFNSEDHIIFIGGVMVPPNETRLVEESFIPSASTADSEPAQNGEVRQQGSEPAQNGEVRQQGSEPDNGGAVVIDREKLSELLKQKQDDVLKVLPDLSFEEIEVLGGLEQEGQARKGILGAVAERLLEHAAGMGQ
ncbi:hypothetical protein LVJ85_08310 [Neisseria sp. Dent CA1/247]|uniref:hypothetical protein n=1 Tax=Neisseria sp. Dent CA1/247 TaxID=2912675 RepID=UPI001FD1F2EF|nr:hypothetical protein [Neisseria sp. Dent CA1/247]UOO76050.1 hypothetical protein LVJ85_08310 [Neisseria sp. Dent CA1/247]